MHQTAQVIRRDTDTECRCCLVQGEQCVARRIERQKFERPLAKHTEPDGGLNDSIESVSRVEEKQADRVGHVVMLRVGERLYKPVAAVQQQIE